MVTLSPGTLSLRAIADSGQCFRLTETEPGRFRLTALGRCLTAEETPAGTAFFCSPAEFQSLWSAYFDLDTDYRRFREAVPPEDPYLTDAVRFGTGIRILRQEPWETLVSFIISQRKNIPAIRRSVELLCRRCGQPLPDSPGLFAFPSPQAVAALPPDALAACSLGYRAGYIHAAAERIADGQLDLAALAGTDDDTLRRALQSVPGVGVKVANCVMLFGFHRLTGFPVDVWMERVLREQYGGTLDLSPYAGFEGVVQQYLFYYARSAARRETRADSSTGGAKSPTSPSPN